MTNPTPHGQVPASSAVLKAIREANMQLVRTGDDAFMLVPYQQAHVQKPAEIEHVAGDVSKNGAEVNMSTQQPTPATFVDDDRVAVPRSLIGAACSAIDKKLDAPKTLKELRRYTVGDLSATPQPAPATQQAPQQEAQEPCDWKLLDREASREYGKEVFVYYGKADFKEGVDPLDFIDGLVPLYTAPQPSPTPQADSVTAPAGFVPVAAFDRLHAHAESLAARLLAAPQQAAQEPHGWLYEWTHSNATGKPDATYTAFTTDEAHARKHDNCRAVCTKSQQEADSVTASAGPSKSLPYEPTSAMLIAAREQDPALPIETVRAIYWAMWRKAPTPPAQAADNVLEDAARYRWIRESERADSLIKSDCRGVFLPQRHALDAAIDKALFTTPAQRGEVAGDGNPCNNDHDPDCRWPDCLCRHREAQFHAARKQGAKHE